MDLRLQSGGSASGKKTVCRMIMDRLTRKHAKANRKLALISMGDFYREFTDEQKRMADEGKFNFDHPDSFDMDSVVQVLDDLRAGRDTAIPSYNFFTRDINPTARILSRPDVVLFEGIFVLYERRIRESLSMRLFVDVDSDVRLAQRVVQDTEHRYKYSLEHVLNQYLRYVKPAYEDFVVPTKKFADVIIPRGSENTAAIDLITAHIEDLLSEIEINAGTGDPRRGSSIGSRGIEMDLGGTRIQDETRSTPHNTPASGVLEIQQDVFFSVPR